VHRVQGTEKEVVGTSKDDSSRCVLQKEDGSRCRRENSRGEKNTTADILQKVETCHPIREADNTQEAKVTQNRRIRLVYGVYSNDRMRCSRRTLKRTRRTNIVSSRLTPFPPLKN
jgi:hypothetical protein